MKITNHPINIIYLNITEKGPSGGGKIIYHHSNFINSLNESNLTSEVLHIKKKKISKWNTSIKKIFNLKNKEFFGWNVNDITIKKNFKPKWINYKVKLKENFNFKKGKDFVIFPEIFAHFAIKLCDDKKIPYAIYVQNGYCLNSTNDYNTLDKAYKNAKFILSNSKDTTQCIIMAFKNSKNRILEINYSIDNKKLNLNVKKSNLITYMPRKLPTHSENLIFFLRNKLPKKWKLKALHNLSENNVFKYFLKSKIFLSFSEMEGFGLPPAEAAIAGNKVIGYSGRGGKEYWKKPIFTEIEHGNILKFINEIYLSINEKNFIKKTKLSRKKIIKKYSLESEENKLIKMIKKIKFSL